MKKSQKYRRKFLVLPNGVTNSLYCEQGIEYYSGLITIGPDNWRNLNPMDCSSYPLKTFNNFLEMKHDYTEIKRKEVQRNVIPQYHTRRHG